MCSGWQWRTNFNVSYESTAHYGIMIMPIWHWQMLHFSCKKLTKSILERFPSCWHKLFVKNVLFMWLKTIYFKVIHDRIFMFFTLDMKILSQIGYLKYLKIVTIEPRPFSQQHEDVTNWDKYNVSFNVSRTSKIQILDINNVHSNILISLIVTFFSYTLSGLFPLIRYLIVISIPDYHWRFPELFNPDLVRPKLHPN